MPDRAWVRPAALSHCPGQFRLEFANHPKAPSPGSQIICFKIWSRSLPPSVRSVLLRAWGCEQVQAVSASEALGPALFSCLLFAWNARQKTSQHQSSPLPVSEGHELDRSLGRVPQMGCRGQCAVQVSSGQSCRAQARTPAHLHTQHTLACAAWAPTHRQMVPFSWWTPQMPPFSEHHHRVKWRFCFTKVLTLNVPVTLFS